MPPTPTPPASATVTPIAPTAVASTPYPGHVLKLGEPNNAAVRVLRVRLNEVGCGPVAATGPFDAAVGQATKLFQSRFTDLDGQPLKVDGQVGPISWAALFGADAVPASTGPIAPLLARALEVAASQVGVMEQPLGSNRGPQVDQYLKSTGTPFGSAWCAAFLYWCFDQAADPLGRANPLVRTGGVLAHWNGARTRGIPRLLAENAIANPALVRPGLIFVISHGAGTGHTGLVEGVEAGKLVTIEGNTNDNGSREGIGVFRRFQRKINSINKGFIDYGEL